MTVEKVICPGCDRKFNSIETMTNHGRSIHWWNEKVIDAMKREHNQEHISMEKATERPWRVDGLVIKAGDAFDSPIAEVINEDEESNAALIVRAVNSHEALVEALEELCKGHSIIGEEKGRKALKLAMGNA